MYKGPYLLPSGIFKRMCHRDGLSGECRFIWIRKGRYSRCVFMVHRGCWIIEQKNSLWSMLCSPHTNLLPVSLPESHSFFKCLQGGCCDILFFLPQEISNPFQALNWYVADMFLAEYKELFLWFQIDCQFIQESSKIKKKLLNFDSWLFVFSKNLDIECRLKLYWKLPGIRFITKSIYRVSMSWAAYLFDVFSSRLNRKRTLPKQREWESARFRYCTERSCVGVQCLSEMKRKPSRSVCGIRYAKKGL